MKKNPKGDFDHLGIYEESDVEDYPKATWKDNLITIVETIILLVIGFAVSAFIVAAITYMVNYSQTPATVMEQKTGIVLLFLGSFTFGVLLLTNCFKRN